MPSTQLEVIRLIAEVLEQPVDSISPQDHFIEHLGASSLDIVTLIMRIESYFDLGETPDSQLESIETVQDLIMLVDVMRSGEPSEVSDVVDVVLASDHAAVELKAHLINWLHQHKISCIDLGPSMGASVDYPDFAHLLCKKVNAHEARLGILLCGTGIGMSIAANKVPGIRAALVSSPLEAKFARQHNDANVLCLGARVIGPMIAEHCVDTFIHTEFTPGEDGRHRRRVQKLENV